MKIVKINNLWLKKLCSIKTYFVANFVSFPTVYHLPDQLNKKLKKFAIYETHSFSMENKGKCTENEGVGDKNCEFLQKIFILGKNKLKALKANKIAHQMQKTVLSDQIFIARYHQLKFKLAKNSKIPYIFDILNFKTLHLKSSPFNFKIIFLYLVGNFVSFKSWKNEKNLSLILREKFYCHRPPHFQCIFPCFP